MACGVGLRLLLLLTLVLLRCCQGIKLRRVRPQKHALPSIQTIGLQHRVKQGHDTATKLVFGSEDYVFGVWHGNLCPTACSGQSSNCQERTRLKQGGTSSGPLLSGLERDCKARTR
jgi:hypothetical protein